jgi:hypothetical protein
MAAASATGGGGGTAPDGKEQEERIAESRRLASLRPKTSSDLGTAQPKHNVKWG